MIDKFYGKSLISIFLLFTFYFSLFTVAACGKKGPPTLKAYEKPEKPSGLTAIHRENRIILSWSYPGNLRSSIKGFHVLRSENGEFERKATVGSDRSSFADEDFNLDVSYKYQVVAENFKGVLSGGSEIITAVPKPLPPPPGDVRFAIKPDSVELLWKSSGEGVCYNIYKSSAKGKHGDVPLNKEPVCANVFRDDSLSPEQSVSFTIKALHKTPLKDEGFPSAEATVKPQDFVPSPPSELAIAMTDDRMYLVWKESPEPWVKGYRLYRKREGEEGFTHIGEAKTPVFMERERSEKRTWYMIKALGPSAESRPVTIEVQ